MNAWTSIGWTAALMLNKLRNDRQIREGDTCNDEKWRDDDGGEDHAATDLTSSNKRAGHQ